MAVERVGSILLGADDLVAELVASRIPYMRDKSFGPCTAMGIISRETLIGGVVFHAFRGHDVQVSIALERVAFVPWRALFDYPFRQLGVRRMTAFVARGNKKSRQLVEALGFKLEGVHKRGVDGVRDAMSYGMLKENCRWLKENRSGQRQANASATPRSG